MTAFEAADVVVYKTFGSAHNRYRYIYKHNARGYAAGVALTVK